MVLEEFFGKIEGAGDLTALAKEYDAKITPDAQRQVIEPPRRPVGDPRPAAGDPPPPEDRP